MIENHLREGTTVEQAARAIGVTPVTFYRWKKRVLDPKDEPQTKPGLVQVQIATSQGPTENSSENNSFTLHLSEDRALVIPAGYDPSELIRLLEIVSAC